MHRNSSLPVASLDRPWLWIVTVFKKNGEKNGTKVELLSGWYETLQRITTYDNNHNTLANQKCHSNGFVFGALVDVPGRHLHNYRRPLRLHDMYIPNIKEIEAGA